MNQIKAAMKAKDKVALNALRALKTAMTNAAIEKGGLGTELSASEFLAVVQKQIKQRRDSIEQYQQAGRAELVEVEQAEIKVLSQFMPKQLSPDELSAAVAEVVNELGATSKADMGKVMGVLQTKIGGQAAGKDISSEVMRQLS